MVTLKAFTRRRLRSMEIAQHTIEQERGRIFAQAAHVGSLKSGRTIRLAVPAAAAVIDKFADQMLADIENPMSKKDRAQAWDDALTSVVQLYLQIPTLMKFELVSDQPSVARAARDLIRKAENITMGRMKDHQAGFVAPGIQTDPHRTAAFAWLERLNESNKALIGVGGFLAGFASAFALMLIERALG